MAYILPRLTKPNHVDFGYHSDCVRDLIDVFAHPEDLLQDYMQTFNAIRTIDGIGAFRVVRLLDA